MYTPRDISDMPESEVPWEFLVDAPERRKVERLSKNADCCSKLIFLEEKLNHLANEFYAFKRLDHAHNLEAENERKQILEKLDTINSHLDRQKGFFAGVVWLGTGLVALVGLAISYFKG